MKLIRLLPLLVLVAAPVPAIAGDPIDIGSRRELMVDDSLVERMEGARLVLHHPQARNIAIVYDEDWEGNSSGYPTIIRDGELYRMYYRGHRMVIDDGPLRMAQGEVVCYAESRDGIHWNKPKLGLVDWKGSTENNIIWRGVGQHNFAPFIDENPDCSPEARFKAVGGTYRTGLAAFQSADGTHWSRMSEEPIYTNGAFDSRNTAFWDPVRNRYALYLRFFSQGQFEGLRSIAEAHSEDFLDWSEQKPLEYPDSPPQQMYTNNIIPYYRAPHILVGFPTRYVARDLTEHVQKLPPVPLRSELTKALKRVGSDLTDGLFMSSRDGVTFKRWDEAFLRPGPEHKGRWIYGDNYQGYGLVETASEDGDGPNKISFLVSEGSWREGETRERRYTIRIDGFVSAQAPLSGGEVLTKPLRFEGAELAINYSTSAAGSVRVELQQQDGTPIEGYRFEDCPEIYGDTIEHVVRWSDGADVQSLAGQPIRVRFVLRDADLYSFRFQ